MSVANPYTCSRCGGVFEKTRPDGEAMAETEAIFSKRELAQGVAIVCDDCFKAFMAWMATDSAAREN
jgi:hypothetical protein